MCASHVGHILAPAMLGTYWHHQQAGVNFETLLCWMLVTLQAARALLLAPVETGRLHTAHGLCWQDCWPVVCL